MAASRGSGPTAPDGPAPAAGPGSTDGPALAAGPGSTDEPALAAAPGTTAGHEFMAPGEWASWLALLQLHRIVLAELDTELRRQHGLAVTEFDVLITLFNAPGQRLRMSALARQVMLSPAGTTHLVTRLERDGLVRRAVDPADRRKWFTVLTRDGDTMLRAARSTHNQVLRRTFLAVTTAADQRTLARLWQRLSRAQPGTSHTASPGR
jgi:DNA-binding MarR family transcriptional regulator